MAYRLSTGATIFSVSFVCIRALSFLLVMSNNESMSIYSCACRPHVPFLHNTKTSLCSKRIGSQVNICGQSQPCASFVTLLWFRMPCGLQSSGTRLEICLGRTSGLCAGASICQEVARCMLRKDLSFHFCHPHPRYSFMCRSPLFLWSCFFYIYVVICIHSVMASWWHWW